MFKKLVLSIAMALFTLPAFCAAQTGNALLDAAIHDYQFQEYQAAEQKFLQVLKSAPDNLTAHYHLGMIQMHSKPRQAVGHLETVYRADPNAPGIEDALASAYMAAGMNDKAMPLWQKLHRQAPTNDKYAFQYGVALQNSGRQKEAEAIYRQLIAKGGSYANPAHYQLGHLYSTLGAYNLATKQFAAIAPDSPYGAAASQYMTALRPVTRPLTLYLSGEFMYNDNPGAASSSRLANSPARIGSQGTTWMAAVNTRQYEFTPQWHLKLGYLFYGTFYMKKAARDNDFVGHYLNPEISFHPKKTLELALKGEIQRLEFSHQLLSNNYGATLTGTWRPDETRSLNIHTGYLNKQYTSDYRGTSLKYLDADSTSVGMGGSITSREWGGGLNADYTYTDEHTNKAGDPLVGTKARDSRYQEHLIRADAVLPLPAGRLERLRLLPSYSYTYRNYPNAQSGTLYTDIPGQQMKVKLSTWSIRLQGLLWKKYNLTLSGGYEYNRSTAQSSILTYRFKRYFGQLAGSY